MDLSALTIQQLRYLVAVDPHRSFREAARACSVSQPALVDVGFGMTILPELVVRGIPSGRRAAQVRPFFEPAPAREISLLHRREQIRKDIGDALFRALREQLPPELRGRQLDAVDRVRPTAAPASANEPAEPSCASVAPPGDAR